MFKIQCMLQHYQMLIIDNQFFHLSLPFIGNVIEQNLVGFPNSMYHHVGCTPYFGSGYRGIGCVFIVWPSMFDPLVKSMT
jgi:hypothetical protein